MKKSGSTEGRPASELIGERITELGDWRGQILGRMCRLIQEVDADAFGALIRATVALNTSAG